MTLVCIFTTSLLVYASYYMCELLLDPNSDKSQVYQHLQQPVSTSPDVLFTKSVDINVNSTDGLSLHGYMFKNASRTWIIAVHGYMSEGRELGWAIKHFYYRGYNVLAPDLRSHGQSKGKYIGLGWDDRLDIMQWISYITKQDPECLIVLYGVSMGAAAIMNAAGENLPKNVKMVIEDSGYTNAKDLFAYHLKNSFSLPQFPLLSITSWIVKARTGYAIEKGPIHQIQKCKLPVLFIHGAQDTFVPIDMMYRLYNEYPNEKEKLVIYNAGHVQSNDADYATYWSTIDTFIHKHLK